MKEFDCEQCGSKMVLEKRLKNTKAKGRKLSYRVRRFKCSNVACEHKKTIFADGVRDEDMEEFFGNEEVKKHYKQQEENQSR